jgi:hypothetical protein
MRELTFEEMDHVAGGNILLGAIAGWVIGKALDYAWDHKEEYWEALMQYCGQYGGAPYDYSHAYGS